MFRTSLKAGALLAATVSVAQPASAEWLKARSKHFVIYSIDNERNLREFATNLERFDAALRLLSRAPEVEGIEANPVTLWMVRDMTVIRALYGDQSSNVGGFYIPKVTGSVAFTPVRTKERGTLDRGEDAFSPSVVFFHEYGHHFLLGNFASAYPAWFSEGYAEVVSTATFDGDTVKIGNAANHRADSLMFGKAPSMERFLAATSGERTAEDVQNTYAFGWLLTHYIMFDDANGRRFGTFLKLLNQGKPSLEAARTAFGDLKALDTDLQRYLKSRLPGKLITLRKDQVSPVTIEPVAAGMEAMMSLRMRSARGVDKEEAARVYAQAKAIAARYPDDGVVQGWLAEIAYDAQEDAAAEAAADRAVALDPKSVQGLSYKGRVLMRRAKASKGDAAAWTAARSWIVRANRADPDNAAPLALYYGSFAAQGTTPSRSAVDGLQKAFELVPQDPGLRMTVARQEIADGHADLARDTLAPIAFNPHAPPNNPAAKLVANLDAGTPGRDALAAYDAAILKRRKEAAAKAGKSAPADDGED